MPSFLKARTRFFERWQMDTVDQIIREDVRDLTRVIETENVPFLILRLPGLHRLSTLAELLSGKKYRSRRQASLRIKKGSGFYVFSMPALIILPMPFVAAITPMKMG